jgi:predicted nucleic acid-binding protein
LVLIGHADLLPELFGQVVIPHAVFSELRSGKAPPEVRRWLVKPPGWLRVETVADEQLTSVEEPQLHLGEREAIALAQLLRADYLIIDERAGRRAAQDRNLAVVGTIGVLNKADAEGVLPDLPGVLVKLRKTSFYLSSELEETLLRRHRERRVR